MQAFGTPLNLDPAAYVARDAKGYLLLRPELRSELTDALASRGISGRWQGTMLPGAGNEEYVDVVKLTASPTDQTAAKWVSDMVARGMVVMTDFGTVAMLLAKQPLLSELGQLVAYQRDSTSGKSLAKEMAVIGGYPEVAGEGSQLGLVAGLVAAGVVGLVWFGWRNW